MFNRRPSSSKSNPDGIVERLSVKQGQSIADVGSGGGYFTLRFASLVDMNGKVYAVDTNPEFLRYIEKSARERDWQYSYSPCERRRIHASRK